MTHEAERLTNMDESLQAHRPDTMRRIWEQLASGELCETHDLCESLCVSGIVGAYAELVAEHHDASDPALHSGIQRALVAGSHLATIIVPELMATSAEQLHALPTSPDQQALNDVAAWAQHQPETGKVAMGVAARLAQEEGDPSLTLPLATAMSFAMYYAATQPIQGKQPAA